MLLASTVALLLGYLWGVRIQGTRGLLWSPWRTLSFVLGVGTLIAGLVPPLSVWGHHSLLGHMVQHLLLGMIAPLGVVFAAPVTLALRSLPVAAAKKLVGFLQSRPVAIVAHPFTALLFNIGGMYLLYLTPLYVMTLHNPVLHGLVHLHFIIAGCLFTWAIAGPDTGPRRPPMGVRLFVLFLSIATHGFLAKVMYAYGWPRGAGHSPADIETAAKLMYYGGDMAEMVLAVALFAGWFRIRQRRLRSDGPAAV